METKIKYLAAFHGVKNQTSQLDEEMAELTVETHKLLRGRTKSLDHLIEEIADVEIMLTQLKILYNIKQSSIDEIKIQKVDREISRIQKRLKEVV